MKYILFIAILSPTIYFAGCSSKKKVDIEANRLLTLNIAGAIDAIRSFDLGEIADEIEFIPLDDNFQRTPIGVIGKMAESESRFYIVDDYRTPIKIFDKTGKFISTVGSAGRGPNEYIELSGLAVDYGKENVYVVDGRGGLIVSSLIAYDSAGRMFSRNDSVIKPLTSWHEDRLVLFRDFFDISTVLGDTVTIVETFSADLHRVEEIKVPYKGSTRLRVGSGAIILVPVFSDNGHSLLIKEVRCDTVFRYLNETTWEPAYTLEMGQYSLPDKLFDIVQSGQPFRTLLEYRERYSWVSNIYEGDRHIIIRTNNGYCVFDQSDSSRGFMATGPEGQNGLFIDGIKFTPMYVRDNRLVGYIQALDIVDNGASITNPDLKAFAVTLKEDSNPVIVVAHLKK
jgi:hypothetical protein